MLVLISISIQAQKYYYNGSEKIEIYLSEKSFILHEDSEQITNDGFEKSEKYLAKKFTILKNKKSDFSIKSSFINSQVSPAFKLKMNEDFEMYPTKTIRVKLLPNKTLCFFSIFLSNLIFVIKYIFF